MPVASSVYYKARELSNLGTASYILHYITLPSGGEERAEWFNGKYTLPFPLPLARKHVRHAWQAGNQFFARGGGGRGFERRGAMSFTTRFEYLFVSLCSPSCPFGAWSPTISSPRVSLARPLCYDDTPLTLP